jgi:hypothetical protein
MSTFSRPEGDSSSPLQRKAQTSKILTHSTTFVTSNNASSVIATTHALTHQVFSNHRNQTSPPVTNKTVANNRLQYSKMSIPKNNSTGNVVYPTKMSSSKPCRRASEVTRSSQERVESLKPLTTRMLSGAYVHTTERYPCASTKCFDTNQTQQQSEISGDDAFAIESLLSPSNPSSSSQPCEEEQTESGLETNGSKGINPQKQKSLMQGYYIAQRYQRFEPQTRTAATLAEIPAKGDKTF